MSDTIIKDKPWYRQWTVLGVLIYTIGESIPLIPGVIPIVPYLLPLSPLMKVVGGMMAGIGARNAISKVINNEAKKS